MGNIIFHKFLRTHLKAFTGIISYSIALSLNYNRFGFEKFLYCFDSYAQNFTSQTFSVFSGKYTSYLSGVAVFLKNAEICQYSAVTLVLKKYVHTFKIKPVNMSKEDIREFLKGKTGFKTYLKKENRELPFEYEA